MELLSKLTHVVYYILFSLVFIAIVGVASFFIYKRRKKSFKGEYDSADYSSLSRIDTKDYIKIDDILDDVIITNAWTRFIGVIDCAGFDFYSMSLQEQLNTAKNYMPFINTINAPLTYRQYSRSADMEDAALRYQEALKKVDKLMGEVFLQIDETGRLLSTASSEDAALCNARLDELTSKLNVLEFRRLHLLDELRYIEEYSGNNVAPLLTETYVFEWDTSKLDAAEAMTKEEIFSKAKVELSTIASAKIHALSMAGVRARRCSTNELIDMFRRHSLPISSERFKKRDICNIDFSADIISSDSIEAYQKKINEERKSALAKQSSALFADIMSEATSEPSLQEPEPAVKAAESAKDAAAFNEGEPL